ncbi:phosphate transporter [Moniliophthora roreri MCA 2997]|uniref:Phosphate transporter n=2 Tax=Moniliophthora roreri TaxID=221103 RepID=V2X485_MONRO|nr:phosphate transporter [Moniliophthora roreri MCA 2997]
MASGKDADEESERNDHQLYPSALDQRAPMNNEICYCSCPDFCQAVPSEDLWLRGISAMKFSSALKFNAVSDWWEEYIDYDMLKKCIYQLEKQQNINSSYQDLESNERTSLVGRPADHQTDSVFVPLLDRQLRKIVLFYEAQEKELSEELEELEELVRQQEELGLEGDHYTDDDFEDDDDDDDSLSRSRDPTLPSSTRRRREGEPDMEDSVNSLSRLKSPKGTLGRLANRLNIMRDSVTSSIAPDIWTAKSNYATDTRLLYKRRITNLFISFSSLRSYVEVNYSGFRKILKKYDKVTYSELKDHYLHDIVEQATPFTQQSKDRLNLAVNRLVELYTKCVARGNANAAKQQLKLHQRENIAWERDTVWRQMIGRERRGEGEGTQPTGATLVKEETPGLFEVPTPAGRLKVTRRKLYFIISVAIFIALLNIQVVDIVEANRCFAVLIFCTILWATEAIPLFVTSISVPLLLVWLQALRGSETPPESGVYPPLSPKEATHYIFSVMFSPTIMLLIGGFTIASALSKTNIDRILITRVLALAGTKPKTVLLAFMGVSCFASMWISNVAAPTLCFTLIRPILRTLPPRTNFAPCLILGIALAANIGGQSSPISSPQNLIALEAMTEPLDWGRWFAVALPVSAISILLIWGLLLASYRPSRSPDGESEIEIRPIRATRDNFTLKQYWVTLVCLVTIALWCVAHAIEDYIGDMGVIAIIPIIAFFSTGVLKKDDFEQFTWTIVFLAMGGIALGKGVTSSGLLDIMGDVIKDAVQGFELYQVVMILSPIVLVISTFISHTIASVLLVPIASEVGKAIGGQENLLIFITGLICSAGMGMPVSGFPNQTAATQEDELGELYLSNVDFLKNGVPASILATLVVSTVGFLLMKAIG